MTTELLFCPYCEQAFPGIVAELASHVNDHLNAEEEQLSKKAIDDLQTAERSSQTHSHPTVPSQGNSNTDEDEIEKVIDPSRIMLRQLQLKDEKLAAKLAADGFQLANSPKLFSNRAQFSDCIEHCYTNIITRVVPYIQRSRCSTSKNHLVSRIDLYSSNIAGLGWDCGYRNIQMLFSALLYDEKSQSILAKSAIREVPSIPEIAGGIENAWKKGYDPEGSANFDGTLTDKAVWIGATEALVLLKSMNLTAFLTDFETPTSKERYDMFCWIYDHFERICGKRNCSLHVPPRAGRHSRESVFPIFCQWQGHSLTIIGAEKSKHGEISLIVLDPSRGFRKRLTTSSRDDGSLFVRDVHHYQFAHPRFQFVSVFPKEANLPTNGVQRRQSIFGKLFERIRGPGREHEITQ